MVRNHDSLAATDAERISLAPRRRGSGHLPISNIANNVTARVRRARHGSPSCSSSTLETTERWKCQVLCRTIAHNVELFLTSGMSGDATAIDNPLRIFESYEGGLLATWETRTPSYACHVFDLKIAIPRPLSLPH
jgi:hypothetical protein